MASFPADRGADVVRALIDVIVENKAYLSEIDGAIGDGDHGINMAKGFSLCGERIGQSEMSLHDALDLLGSILMESIGGSMGPLYGMFFMGLAEGAEGKDRVDATTFQAMLGNALENLRSISDATVGDKCIMDTLVPACETFAAATTAGGSFEMALDRMVDAAEFGRDSTKDLVASVGRASRLGERSRGTLDAGATSCALLLSRMAESVKPMLA